MYQMTANLNPNIWESLLKESSKRVQLPDGAVLFLGNASCGKTALVGRVCADSDGPAQEDVPKIPDITAYDSFVASDMDEVRPAPLAISISYVYSMIILDFPTHFFSSLQTLSDNFSTSRVGVWSISEKSFKGAAALVLQPSRIERVRYYSRILYSELIDILNLNFLQLVVMIGVDLSKPLECRDNLLAWLKYLRFQLDNHYFKAMPEPEVGA